MFSPTHTPPLESGSEDEGDLDLPDINVGTPNKKPKLEAPAAAEPNPSSARLPRLSSRGSSSSDCCASENPPPSFSPARRNSTSASTVARSLPNEEKPAASPTAAVRDNLFKSARFDVRVMVDGLRYLSPVKIDDSREINQSKKTANRVKKLTRNLKEKTDLEKKVCFLPRFLLVLSHTVLFSWRSFGHRMGSREYQRVRRRNWQLSR